ncbi:MULTISPECIES: hypothetical protein [Olivibacter]|jgi:hypothetical protein|uniref:Uncharacterized protein n=1 Tax=Olivibacter oleidegradans TaxID=760123 RepID=A0ABV6HKD6_9SPHI|nr:MULTISPECIES: hypothetical protein [Olivibacter]MDM8175137.1 hypothetical protein [Olivibacter sp. 47]QEL01910.1 hypothetical protein FKG96_14205 [Olivibacter sp. LS-1]
MNILITGGMSALAQKLARVFSAEDKVIFGDNVAIPDLLIAGGRYVVIPSGSSASFNHELLKVGISNESDLIIPLRKDEIVQLAACKDLFAEYGIQLAVPSHRLLEIVEFIVNPGKDLNTTVLLKGKIAGQGEPIESLENESGVCVVSDGGEELFFCCLA